MDKYERGIRAMQARLDKRKKSIAKKYYTLIANTNGHLSIEFGDYDKTVVQDELDDLHYNSGTKKKDWLIITHMDDEIISIDENNNVTFKKATAA